MNENRRNLHIKTNSRILKLLLYKGRRRMKERENEKAGRRRWLAINFFLFFVFFNYPKPFKSRKLYEE